MLEYILTIQKPIIPMISFTFRIHREIMLVVTKLNTYLQL
jgi:hypothetical protein